MGPTAGELSAITPAPSYQAVADVLRRRIALGVYFPGNRLPSERQLAEVLGVGRATIRAATRLLAHEGLVVTKRGRWGGTVVSDKGRGVPHLDRSALRREVRDVFEFRMLVEPGAARLAAERATAHQRKELVALAEQNPISVAAYRAQDSRLHLTIATVSGNRLVLSSLETARADFFTWADAFFDTDWDPRMRPTRESQREHRRIAEAIATSDGAAASRLMLEHLERAQDTFERIVSRSG